MNAEINMIPLIDVMLVLLIVFMVTTPLMTQSIEVRLPKTVATPNTPPAVVRLGIDSEGALHWNGEPVSEESLSGRLSDLAASAPTTEIHVFADRDTRYNEVANVMARASSAGLSRLGLETQAVH